MKKIWYTLVIFSLLAAASCKNKPDGTPQIDSNTPNSDMSGHAGGSNKISNDEKYGEHSDADTSHHEHTTRKDTGANGKLR